MGMAGIENLLAIMARLRDPQTGCAWDLKQDFDSIARYTLEEAYEVVDAITRRHYADLREELGDLLLQVVFHARMAEEAGLFRFSDVVQELCDKLVRRHPHVFGTNNALDADQVKEQWEVIKKSEKEQKGIESKGALEAVKAGLPEWLRAEKLQGAAARVGFEWPTHDHVFAKLQEEITELQNELSKPETNKKRIEDELGDILFVCANLARRLGVDTGSALRHANQKFIDRFKAMENEADSNGLRLDALDLKAQLALWEKIKTVPRTPG